MFTKLKTISVKKEKVNILEWNENQKRKKIISKI